MIQHLGQCILLLVSCQGIRAVALAFSVHSNQPPALPCKLFFYKALWVRGQVARPPHSTIQCLHLRGCIWRYSLSNYHSCSLSVMYVICVARVVRGTRNKLCESKQCGTLEANSGACLDRAFHVVIVTPTQVNVVRLAGGRDKQS